MPPPLFTPSGDRYISTVASIIIQAFAGGSYAFSIYSPTLKSSQSYTQSTLDTISVFKDIGANAGVLSGLLFTATTPWVVITAGAAQCFVGYLMLWLAVVGVVRVRVWEMCGFMFLAAHAQTFFNTGNVVVGVENFGEYGGTIVGIMKGFLGLSGAILIQIYQALLKGNPSSFILMLALLPSSVSLLLMFFVRICHVRGSEDKKHLNRFSIVALVVAGYLMIVIILENIFTFPLGARVATLIILLILLFSPLKIALQARSNELGMGLLASPDERDLLVHETEGETEKQKADNYGKYRKFPDDPDQQDTVTETEALAVDESKNILEAMRTLEFWFLFIAMACGMGSGLATINNMSQIAESLGYDTIQRNTLVSLWSIWNFLGRFGAGYVSDVLLHRNGWARPTFMVITLASMAVGHIIIASGFPGNLYIATVLVGICYGSQWSLMPTITSEIFGVLHMGTIFNTIAIASPVGSYFLSVRVIGYLYDKEAGQADSCSGTHCFMLSFSILACVCLFGSGIALMLFFRTRGFYRSIVLRRLQIL
ncbi:hypothetical protein Droror1_Dr00012303 [Drosera rotundifolia]